MKPPIQNIPLRTDVARQLKAALLANKGPSPEIDYASIELRAVLTPTPKPRS